MQEKDLPASFNAYQPNLNTLKVEWNYVKDSEFDIQLLDMSGKIIKTEHVSNSEHQATFEDKVYLN